MFRFRGSKKNEQEVTTLGLSPPPQPPTQVAPEQKQTLEPAQLLKAKQLADAYGTARAKYQNSPVPEEIRRRVTELLANGNVIKAVYYLRGGGDGSVLTFSNNATPRNTSVAIFGSPILADFYGRATKVPYVIHQVLLDEFAPLAKEWKELGIDSFIFNLSPKAPLHNVMKPKDQLIAREQLLYVWALGRVIRNSQAQSRLGEFLNREKHPNPNGAESLQQQRIALEEIRDNGAFDVPFVHWVIALIAGMQGDEPARLEATEALERFGPDFAGKTAILAEREDAPAWFDSWAKATIGLYTEFQMLNGPDGKLLPSMLRVEEKPYKPPGA